MLMRLFKKREILFAFFLLLHRLQKCNLQLSLLGVWKSLQTQNTGVPGNKRRGWWKNSVNPGSHEMFWDEWKHRANVNMNITVGSIKAEVERVSDHYSDTNGVKSERGTFRAPVWSEKDGPWCPRCKTQTGRCHHSSRFLHFSVWICCICSLHFCFSPQLCVWTLTENLF